MSTCSYICCTRSSIARNDGIMGFETDGMRDDRWGVCFLERFVCRAWFRRHIRLVKRSEDVTYIMDLYFCVRTIRFKVESRRMNGCMTLPDILG